MVARHKVSRATRQVLTHDPAVVRRRDAIVPAVQGENRQILRIAGVLRIDIGDDLPHPADIVEGSWLTGKPYRPAIPTKGAPGRKDSRHAVPTPLTPEAAEQWGQGLTMKLPG